MQYQHPNRVIPITDREIVRLYGQMTMQQIADRYGVTRSRIQQIIANQGVTRMDGLIHKRAVLRKQHRRALSAMRKSNSIIDRWGCTHEEMIRLNGGRPMKEHGTLAYAFKQKRNNALRQHAKWYITFPEWCALWKGHAFPNGLSRNAECVCRINPSKPYTIDNVCIAPLYRARGIQKAASAV